MLFLLCFSYLHGVAASLLSFRALERSDFELLQRWLSEPHVDAWWHEPLDLTGLEKKYGPRIDGTEPTHVFIIEHDTRPIGWIQWYRWSDYPKHSAQLEAGPGTAGLDLSIGEPSSIGMGIGPMAIREFILNVVSAEASITAVVTDPEERNSRSCRAFEKAGFTSAGVVRLEGEEARRIVMRLSLPMEPASDSGAAEGPDEMAAGAEAMLQSAHERLKTPAGASPGDGAGLNPSKKPRGTG